MVLSQTVVLTFGCTGLQLASPKVAFVHVGEGGMRVHSCMCVCMSVPGPCHLHYVVCVPMTLQQSLCYVYHANCALCPFQMFL